GLQLSIDGAARRRAHPRPRLAVALELQRHVVQGDVALVADVTDKHQGSCDENSIQYCETSLPDSSDTDCPARLPAFFSTTRADGRLSASTVTHTRLMPRRRASLSVSARISVP